MGLLNKCKNAQTPWPWIMSTVYCIFDFRLINVLKRDYLLANFDGILSSGFNYFNTLIAQRHVCSCLSSLNAGDVPNEWQHNYGPPIKKCHCKKVDSDKS